MERQYCNVLLLQGVRPRTPVPLAASLQQEQPSAQPTCAPRQHREQLLLEVAPREEPCQLPVLVGLDHGLAQGVLLAGNNGDLAAGSGQ